MSYLIYQRKIRSILGSPPSEQKVAANIEMLRDIDCEDMQALLDEFSMRFESGENLLEIAHQLERHMVSCPICQECLATLTETHKNSND